MKKPIALLLILSLISNHFSKKLTIFAEDSVVKTSFEDGDFSMLTPRGEYDASTFEIKKDGGKTGDNYLWITDRKETWNGAQFDIAAKCKEGEEYIASVAVKTEGSGNVCLSMQYAEDGGEDQYKNLKCFLYLSFKAGTESSTVLESPFISKSSIPKSSVPLVFSK